MEQLSCCRAESFLQALQEEFRVSTQMRDKLIAGRDSLVAEYEGRLAEADELLVNMNLALGELQA